MKNITFKIFTTILLVALFITACKKKEDDNLETPSHQVIFTSEMDFENTIQINGKISFGDVSAGVASRTWTFPEGVVDIIDSDNDVTSTEANVHTIFTEVGVYEVKLYQLFEKEAYVGTNLEGKEFNSTIIITVLDSINVQIEAHYLDENDMPGDPLVIADNAENEIPAARSVRFTWTGEGEPEFILWDFERAGPDFYYGMETETDVKYKFLGTYDLMVIGSRGRPFGRDTLILENFIKVIPSTDPVLVEEIFEKGGKIAVAFGRELDENTLQDIDFSVSVENNGLITNSFQSISLDPEEGNVALIDLGQPIYNNDTIRVSFTEGTLNSLDGVAATGFTDEWLVFRKTNILETNSEFDFGFENTTSNSWVYSGWGDNWGDYTLEVNSDNPYEGEQSAYVVLDPMGGMVCEQKDLNDYNVTFPASASKTYELGVWVFVEDLGNTDPNILLQPNLRFFWTPNFPNALDNPEFPATFPVGEWVYSSNYVTFDGTDDYFFQIRAYNAMNPEPLKFYFDNIGLYEVELRP